MCCVHCRVPVLCVYPVDSVCSGAVRARAQAICALNKIPLIAIVTIHHDGLVEPPPWM
jgi:hypothetical protein